ncbi:MAG TPA: hypothetical protein PLV42_00940 [bacterium]|nr:hypothetical protein [bacterium]
MRYLLLPLLLLSLTVTAAEEKKPTADAKPTEAKVTFEKKADGVLYTIAIDPPFKMNRQAPFKFELRKSEQELIKKVELAEFKKDEKNETYQYTSTTGEKRFHYWFIACKYKGDEVVACKTFTAKQDIP